MVATREAAGMGTSGGWKEYCLREEERERAIERGKRELVAQRQREGVRERVP
jgi:hypothetical protein